MAKVKSAKVLASENAYGHADKAYGLVKQARVALLEAVRADPMRDHLIEPIWRALARVGGELGAVVDRIGDEIDTVTEQEVAAGQQGKPLTEVL